MPASSKEKIYILDKEELSRRRFVDPETGEEIYISQDEKVRKNSKTKEYSILHLDMSQTPIMTQQAYNMKNVKPKKDLINLSLSEWKIAVRFACGKRDRNTVRFLVKNYEKFSRYFSGCRVNLGTSAAPNWVQISARETLENYKIALGGQNQFFANFIWFHRKEVELVKCIHGLDTSVQANILSCVFSCYRSCNISNVPIENYINETVKTHQKRILILQACLSKTPVKPTLYTQAKIAIINYYLLLFQAESQTTSILPVDSSKSTYKQLATHFSLTPNKTAQKEQKPRSISKKRTISNQITPQPPKNSYPFFLARHIEDQLYSDEKSVQDEQPITMPLKKCNTNSYNIFCPQKTDDSMRDDIDSQSLIGVYNEWTRQMRIALEAGDKNIIDSQWAPASELLKNYFYRKKVNSNSETNPYRISVKDCFLNFRASLLSHQYDFISIIWEDNASELINYIQQLSDDMQTQIFNEMVKSEYLEKSNPEFLMNQFKEIASIDSVFTNNLKHILSDKLDKLFPLWRVQLDLTPSSCASPSRAVQR